MFDEVQHIVFADVDIRRAYRAAARVKMLLAEAEIGPRNIGIDFADASDLSGIYASDVIVTATYGVPGHGESPVITDKDKLRDGTIIAAVGADLKGKRELSDEIYGISRFLADDLGQCFIDGELQHAAKQLSVDPHQIKDLDGYGGTLLDGRVMGVADFVKDASSFLRRPEPVVIYDSTGFSGQDYAVAEVVKRFLDGLGWPKRLWNPPGDLDLYELVTDPERRPHNVSDLTSVALTEQPSKAA